MKRLLIFTIFFVFLGRGDVFAEIPFEKHPWAVDIEPTNQQQSFQFDTHPIRKPREIKEKEQWELGLEAYDYTYKEPDYMKEDGLMSGIIGSYSYNSDIMLKAEARGSWGSVDYTALFNGTDFGTCKNIDDYSFEVRGLSGYNFFISYSLTITPYLGIGYRFLNDDMSNKFTSGGLLGIESESNYFYSPAGIKMSLDIVKGWAFGIILEYDHLWRGKQKNDWSTYYPELFNFPEVNLRQKQGKGYQASLEITKRGKRIDFAIEPFIRYWNIRDSEITTFVWPDATVSFIHPKNRTIEMGIKSALLF